MPETCGCSRWPIATWRRTWSDWGEWVSPKGSRDKGYIYTDRPAYRPGQTVQVRGCLRRAVADVYTIEKGKKYALEMFDPRGRLLWRETVKLGEFGTFPAQIALPAVTPRANTASRFMTNAGRNFTGGFVVQRVSFGSRATG